MHDAYAAGLFDGEGHVKVDRYWVHQRFKTKPYMRYQLQAALTLTHAPTIQALYQNYGGWISRNNVPKANSSKNRIQYAWGIQSGKAAEFLRRIYPYSITKAEQIALAIAFQDHVVEVNPLFRKFLKHGGPPNAAEIYTWRDNLIEEMRRLGAQEYDIAKEDLKNISVVCDGPIAA